MRGLALKNSAASELLQAIHEVSLGRSYVTPLATRGLVETFLRRPEPSGKPADLSPRQREVLQLLAEGHTMKEIARVQSALEETDDEAESRSLQQTLANRQTELAIRLERRSRHR